MSLRKKLLIFLIVYVVLWLSAMSGIFNGIAMRGYNTLEEERLQANIERLESAMEDMITRSELILSDWVEWDDTYTYIHNQNPAYIASNISSGVMEDQGLDYIVIYDAVDQPINIFEYHGGRVVSIEDDDLTAELILHKNESGILLHRGRPLVFSAQRVTTTDEMALRKGLMVFAYYLDIDDVRAIAQKLELDFKLVGSAEPFDDDSDKIAVFDHGSYKTALFKYGYSNMPMGIALQFTYPQSIIALGRDTINDVLRASVLTFIIISIILYIGVRYFATRISNLSANINAIAHSGDLSLRLDNNGNDEVSHLADDVNTMLERIEEMNNKLAVYASLDMMTEVYNRRVGFEKLEQRLNDFDIARDALTICYIDINNLKIVNDTYGHGAGDDLIITISSTIKDQVHDDDIVCRIGGDEFLIIFPGKKEHEAQETVKNIEGYLERVSQKKPYSISISKGFLEYDGVQKIHDFIEQADHFMYEDKKALRDKT